VGICQRAGGGGRAATGRRAHAASWRQPAAQLLGHLGHLGHGFKLQAGAGGHCLWVIWVICFLLTQMTQKAQIWRPGNFPALGHLGHFVTLQKSARVELSTWRYTVYIYSTYI
jgi:hypothetical protein